MSLGWQYEYLHDAPSVAFASVESLVPLSSSSTAILPGPNAVVAGADLLVILYDYVSLQFEYDLTYNNLIFDHEFELRAKWEF
jgi:hypothetical protein